MIYNDVIKNKAWDSLVVQRPKPQMLTEKRIQKLKRIIWDNDDFWCDILTRHALINYSLDELDPFTKDHAIGNFWGMLCQYYIMSK